MFDIPEWLKMVSPLANVAGGVMGQGFSPMSGLGAAQGLMGGGAPGGGAMGAPGGGMAPRTTPQDIFDNPGASPTTMGGFAAVPPTTSPNGPTTMGGHGGPPTPAGTMPTPQSWSAGTQVRVPLFGAALGGPEVDLDMRNKLAAGLKSGVQDLGKQMITAGMNGGFLPGRSVAPPPSAPAPMPRPVQVGNIFQPGAGAQQGAPVSQEEAMRRRFSVGGFGVG